MPYKLRKKLRKLLNLGARERGLLLEAALLIQCVDLGLSFLGYKKCMSILTHWSDSGTSPGSTMAFSRLTELVHLAAAHVPRRPTCLVESLTLWFLLRRAGISAQIHIAFRKHEQLEGHAWVESEGLHSDTGSCHPARFTKIVGFES